MCEGPPGQLLKEVTLGQNVALNLPQNTAVELVVSLSRLSSLSGEYMLRGVVGRGSLSFCVRVNAKYSACFAEKSYSFSFPLGLRLSMQRAAKKEKVHHRTWDVTVATCATSWLFWVQSCKT